MEESLAGMTADTPAMSPLAADARCDRPPSFPSRPRISEAVCDFVSHTASLILAWIIHEHFCLISAVTSSCVFILLGR